MCVMCRYVAPCGCVCCNISGSPPRRKFVLNSSMICLCVPFFSFLPIFFQREKKKRNGQRPRRGTHRLPTRKEQSFGGDRKCGPRSSLRMFEVCAIGFGALLMHFCGVPTSAHQELHDMAANLSTLNRAMEGVLQVGSEIQKSCQVWIEFYDKVRAKSQP